MPSREPLLVICDLVAWRLDLFEQALRDALQAIRPAGGFKLTAGYRLRDDLVLVSIEHSLLDPEEMETLIFAQRNLPGLRRLRVPEGGRTAMQAQERGFASCEVVTQSTEPAEVVLAIRAAIGMGRDQRAAYRLAVEVPMSIETPGGWLSATTRDLSAGGVFIRTRQPLDLGETYPVEFFPDPSGLDAARGMLTVVREEAEGFGARVQLTAQGQARIYQHLRAARLPSAASEEVLPPSSEPTRPMRAVRTKVATVQERLAADIEEALAAPSARALVAVGLEPLREQLVRKLSRIGFEVLVAESGAHALQLLVDELLALDALVIDERLSDMSGCELLVQIRRAGGETALPVVAMTSEDEGPSRTAFLEAGASATLPVRGVESMTHASLLSLLSWPVTRGKTASEEVTARWR